MAVDSAQYDTAQNLTLLTMLLRGTSEKYEYLGENETKNQTILTHWSVAQAGSNDENNRRLKILLDCPFKRFATYKVCRSTGLSLTWFVALFSLMNLLHCWSNGSVDYVFVAVEYFVMFCVPGALTNNLERPAEHSLPLSKLTNNISSEWEVG